MNRVTASCKAFGAWDESKHPRDPKGEFTDSAGNAIPMGTIRGGRRLEFGPGGSKVWVPRGPKDYGGPKQASAQLIFLKVGPQYTRIARHGPKMALLNKILPQAQAAVQPLLDAIGRLKPRERKVVARALVNAISPHLASVAKAGYDPNEARDNAGKWTVGGIAGAGARLAGRSALALGGLTLRTIQDALSAVTLVPSSKSSVGGALKEWWGRATSHNEFTAADARIEAMGRVLGTIFVAIGVWAVAQYYIPIALDSVGMAVSRVIGHALNIGVP